jgi:hypothetical protein
MRFIPDASPQEVAAYKIDFGKWILTTGLRELVEAYEISLDRMHAECLRLYSLLGKRTRQRKGKSFEFLGLERKLAALEHEFGILTDATADLSSLMKARHCLSHRGGVVAREDCKDSDRLLLKFKRLRVFAKQPSGEELEIRDVIAKKIVLLDGANIMMQLQEVEKPFPIGSAISLSPEEIQDVLWTIYRSATNLRQTFEALVAKEVEEHNSARTKRSI